MVKDLSKQEASPNSFIENWPFFWMSQVNATYASALEQRTKAHGIDLPRWRAMMSLHEGKYLSVSEIAEFSAQKLNTTTKVVQRMLNDGLVTTRVRPSDGRVTDVCLTEKGEKLRKKALVEAEKIFEHAFNGIDAVDIQKLNKTLSAINVRLKQL